MPKQYSIAEAHDHFTALVEEVEHGAILELTHRGKPVAVLLSFQEYKRLTTPRSNFWEAYITFRNQVDLQALDIESDTWADIRGS